MVRLFVKEVKLMISAVKWIRFSKKHKKTVKSKEIKGFSCHLLNILKNIFVKIKKKLGQRNLGNIQKFLTRYSTTRYNIKNVKLGTVQLGKTKPKKTRLN